MKTLNNLDPHESKDLLASFSLDFNTRVLTSRLRDCINCNHVSFKNELTYAIERWMDEIDDISKKLVPHENETKDNTSEDA